MPALRQAPDLLEARIGGLPLRTGFGLLGLTEAADFRRRDPDIGPGRVLDRLPAHLLCWRPPPAGLKRGNRAFTLSSPDGGAAGVGPGAPRP